MCQLVPVPRGALPDGCHNNRIVLVSAEDQASVCVEPSKLDTHTHAMILRRPPVFIIGTVTSITVDVRLT
jgi:hypothetical protein